VTAESLLLLLLPSSPNLGFVVPQLRLREETGRCGELYVADDQAGRIWRIVYVGK
jgi:glucose/arabinose dehydrogenase